MKHRYLLSLIVILSLCSCGIQKRHYRPGFYIPERGCIADDRGQQSSVSTSQSAVSTEESKVSEVDSSQMLVCNEKKARVAITEKKVVSMGFIQTKAVRQLVPQIVEEAKRSAVETQAVPGIKAKASYDDDLEIFLWCGMALFFSGIAMVLIGACLKAYPVISEVIMVAGGIAMLVGYISMGIANPELFFEVIFEVLFSVIAGL